MAVDVGKKDWLQFGSCEGVIIVSDALTIEGIEGIQHRFEVGSDRCSMTNVQPGLLSPENTQKVPMWSAENRPKTPTPPKPSNGTSISKRTIPMPWARSR